MGLFGSLALFLVAKSQLRRLTLTPLLLASVLICFLGAALVVVSGFLLLLVFGNYNRYGGTGIEPVTLFVVVLGLSVPIASLMGGLVKKAAKASESAE